jgi:hypothetical protein
MKHLGAKSELVASKHLTSCADWIINDPDNAKFNLSQNYLALYFGQTGRSIDCIKNAGLSV